MMQTSHLMVWTQLAYIFPTVLVATAAVIACIVNWQKSPSAALFCLIGFCLIGCNSIFGAVLTAWMAGGNGNFGELLVLISAGRSILNLIGLVFVLIAVFSDRQTITKPNLFATVPGAQPKS